MSKSCFIHNRGLDLGSWKKNLFLLLYYHLRHVLEGSCSHWSREAGQRGGNTVLPHTTQPPPALPFPCSHCAPLRLSYGAIFASVAPVPDICFVVSEAEADAPPVTRLRELMALALWDISISCLWGDEEKERRNRGEEKRRRGKEAGICFHCLLSIGWNALWH